MTVEAKAGEETQTDLDKVEDKQTETEAVNPLGMSDDDFLKAPLPGSETVTNEGADTEKDKDKTAEAGASDDDADKADKADKGGKSDEDEGADKSKIDDTGKDPNADDKSKDKGTEKAAEKSNDKSMDKGTEKTGDKDADKTKDAGEGDDKATQFQIPSSFKANGKDIELKSPEEAIKLMQMGANYTRKLQEIAPHRKMLLMIQDNGLTEDKLSYLIDLDKKNPEAIKKLIKDAGIDPLEIDTSTEPKYLGGNHAPSDEEANFRSAVSDLSAEPKGKETLAIINSKWDDASKDVLWKSPDIMSAIHEQRENGIYDAITSEMDRRITLGEIPPNTPFLQAYKMVGDSMAAAAMEAQKTVEAGGGKSEPKVIDTRAAAPKSKVKDDDKASAASPTRSTPSKAETIVNPLAMSDDDFLKSMDKRL